VDWTWSKFLEAFMYRILLNKQEIVSLKLLYWRTLSPIKAAKTKVDIYIYINDVITTVC